MSLPGCKWLFIAVVVILVAGVVSLAVVAKEGQFRPDSSLAKQVSMSSKMSECRSLLSEAAAAAIFRELFLAPLAREGPEALVPVLEALVPRAPGVFEFDRNRPPPSLRTFSLVLSS